MHMDFLHRNLIVTLHMPKPLKASKAREITKESVTEAETLVVNGVQASKPQQSPM